MGTRGLTGFRLEGILYAMYNHSDSYPEELGQEMLEFCKLIPDWNSPVIRKRVSKIKLVNNLVFPTMKKIAKYAKFHCVPNEVLWQGGTDWYWLLHDLQGVGIVATIVTGKVKHMIDYAGFLTDALSCEWAYIINLDEQTLEVWHKAKLLYEYILTELPEFMLGTTNEFRRQYALDRNRRAAQIAGRMVADWGISYADL